MTPSEKFFRNKVKLKNPQDSVICSYREIASTCPETEVILLLDDLEIYVRLKELESAINNVDDLYLNNEYKRLIKEHNLQ